VQDLVAPGVVAKVEQEPPKAKKCVWSRRKSRAPLFTFLGCKGSGLFALLVLGVLKRPPAGAQLKNVGGRRCAERVKKISPLHRFPGGSSLLFKSVQRKRAFGQKSLSPRSQM